MKLISYVAGVIIVVGVFFGVRFIASTIYYGCHQDRITNIEDGDDCAPPIMGAGIIGFYLTGGSFNPVFNQDATTVRKVSWVIEDATLSNANQNDSGVNEQKIFADVTTYDGQIKRYDLGTAYNCESTEVSEVENKTIVVGRVLCGLEESSVKYIAFKSRDGFYIEQYNMSAGDDDKTVLVEIK